LTYNEGDYWSYYYSIKRLCKLASRDLQGSAFTNKRQPLTTPKVRPWIDGNIVDAAGRIYSEPPHTTPDNYLANIHQYSSAITF
jgi:hypothetical protein